LRSKKNSEYRSQNTEVRRQKTEVRRQNPGMAPHGAIVMYGNYERL
jgi:hypothetical protein